MDVLCLGLLVADVIAKPVEELPGRGRLELVDKIELHSGGGAVNVSNALGKLGVKTGIIGKVGEDGFGDFLIKILKSYGVDTRGIKRASTNTSSTMVLVSPDGERSFLHYLGANGELSLKDIDFALIKQSKILHIAYAFLLPSLDGLPMADLLKKAKEEGITTSLDVAWDPQNRWLDLIEPSLKYADVFLPSIEEAKMITQKDNPSEIADFFLSYGIKIVGLKMGKKGCYVKTQDQELSIPACAVKAVDTTGAGDSFIAGFLTGLVKDWNLEKCAKFANTVGASCVTAVGASAGIKTLGETLRFTGEE